MSSSVVTLRPINDADSEFLLRVYRSTREEELAMTDFSEEQKAAFVRQQFEAQTFEYRNAYPRAEFAVIEVDGQPAGRLYLNQLPDQLRIVDITLLPEFRGRGIGGQLLGGILRRGDELGLPVSIHVERFNPALRLYDRLGFRPVQDRGVYVLMARPVGGVDPAPAPTE